MPNDSIISERQFLIDEIVEIAKAKVLIFNKKLGSFMATSEKPLAS
jgi:hypothetical protein